MRHLTAPAVAACLFLIALAAPGKASAEAMLHACNEASEPVSLAVRVYGLAWEKATLQPGHCQRLRVSGFNLLFDAATLWHGAKLRLQPLKGSETQQAGFCEWKIDFGAKTWQHHAIRIEEDGILCVINHSAPEAAA
ncbi:MAG TPA: hypothetical protein VKY54_14800 [Kiloniellales bacterium]|nr:hypothetical protein [Kiloniellales bacterium]